jgi:type II restriction enzyme
MLKIREAQQILKSLGLPKEQQNEMAALTLLALAGLKPRDSWPKTTNNSCTVTKDIMSFTSQYYKKEYAPNTRETFRRHVLHQFVQGHIINYNPDNPSLPTNSPKAHYALTEEALDVLKSWKTNTYKQKCKDFLTKYGALDEVYKKPRHYKQTPLHLSDGSVLQLSPGKHNQLQAAVLKEFGPRFAPGAVLVYFGDTAKKNLFYDSHLLSEMGIQIDDHSKLPDIILLDKKKKTLFLIEAVTSHGPMTPKRVVELESIFKKPSLGLIFISAFPDLHEYQKHVTKIAWETEVWIAEVPDHLIHYNGARFLGPHS